MIKFKNLAITFLCSLSFSVLAQSTWITVDQSRDGAIGVQVDSESFSMLWDKDEKDSTRYLISSFRIVENSQTIEFVMVTGAATCLTGGGVIFEVDVKEEKWKILSKHTWARSGKTLPDVAGNTLCGILRYNLKEAAENSTKL